MSKQILPNELAELVTGLLVKPGLLNELDSPSKHQAFMLDIGRVVAEHCGGDVYGVIAQDSEENYLGDGYSSPMLSVNPDSNLPSLNNNVWAYYDTEGWELKAKNQDDIDEGEEMSPEAIANVRSSLQGLLSTSVPDAPVVKALDIAGQNMGVIIAALRHLQRSIEAGENLTAIGDIVELDSLDPKSIDLICEEINLGREEEHYQVVAMSTSHLTEADRDSLLGAVGQRDQMVLQRDTGFFVKLFVDETESNFRHGDSETIKNIIRWAHRSGYQMIEFDCDAAVLPRFPVFDQFEEDDQR